MSHGPFREGDRPFPVAGRFRLRTCSEIARDLRQRKCFAFVRLTSAVDPTSDPLRLRSTQHPAHRVTRQADPAFGIGSVPSSLSSGFGSCFGSGRMSESDPSPDEGWVVPLLLNGGRFLDGMGPFACRFLFLPPWPWYAGSSVWDVPVSELTRFREVFGVGTVAAVGLRGAHRRGAVDTGAALPGMGNLFRR